MISASDIEAAAESNAHARRIVADVEEQLRRLAEASNSKGVSLEIIHETALAVVAATLKGAKDCDDGPPWPPPRYHMKEDRGGKLRRMAIHDPDEGDVKVYALVNFYERDGQPGEVFVEKQSDSTIIGALLDALATSVSIGLQYGVPYRDFAAKFERTTFPPRGMTEDTEEDLVIVSSVLDYLFRWITKKVTKRIARQKTSDE